MSAITLADLRADFEAARLVVDQLPRPTAGYRGNAFGHRYEWMEDADRCATSFGGQIPDFLDDVDDDERVYLAPMERNILAARLYVIARDFGEYDPKKAMMIWKLQNGGV